MFSLGSKTFFGFSLVTFAVGSVYLFATNDLAGLTLLGVACAVSALLGVAGVAATGAGDRMTSLVGHDDPRANRAPRASIAPALVAASAGVAVLGAAYGIVAYVAAVVVAVTAGLVWFITAWREHPSYTAQATPRVSDRLSLPLGLPVVVLALIAVIVISFSRILLAVSKNGATTIALVAAVVILGAGVAAALRPTIDRRLVAVLGAVAAIAVGTLGIVGIALGERDFAQHQSEPADGATHGEEGTPAGESGADAEAPAAGAGAEAPAGTQAGGAAGGADHG